MHEHEIVLFCLVAFFASLIQSFSGFAGALTAIPLFALFMSPKEAVPIYSLVMLVIDAWLVFEARQHLRWSRIGGLVTGGFIGVPIGALCLRYLAVRALIVGISIVTLAFGVLFLRIHLRLKETAPTQLWVGLLSGFLGGSISQSGPPVVMYGLSRDWEKDVFRSTLISYFTCLLGLSVVCYGGLGLINAKTLQLFGASIVPALLAANCGVLLKNRVSEARFRQVVLFVVIAVSVVGLCRAM